MDDNALRRLFREVADLPMDARVRHFDAHGISNDMRAEVESLLRFDTRSHLPVMDGGAASTVPEPATLLLVAAPALGLAVRRRRRERHQRPAHDVNR